MRLLTFTTLFPNQIEREQGVFIFQRMAHVARRGNSVEVVAPVPYFPSWFPSKTWHTLSLVPRHEQIGGLIVHHPRYPLLPKLSMPVHGLLLFLGSFALVRRLHQQTPFDCIDAHYVFPDGFAAVLLGKMLRVPVVVSARGTDMNLFPQFRLIRPMIRWTLRRVAGGIAVCTPLQEAMLHMGLPAAKAQVIGNGVDVERFLPTDRAFARRRLGLPENAQVIVSVGALIPLKGFHLLLPAVARIQACRQNLMLYIVGNGYARAELERLARDLGVESRVRFVGTIPNEELRYWYSAGDISCLVSSREGWPNVLLESMACGTPVVATRVSGVPEVIVSSDLGILVEQCVDSIVSGLELALSKRWDREVIARFAQQRTWDVVAKEVERYLATACLPAAL